MRFDLHLRASVQEQVSRLAETMRSWEDQPRMGEIGQRQISDRLELFEHTCRARQVLRFAGTDGSGDFPAVSYSDSFIYVTVAQGTLYESDNVTGLREVGPVPDPVIHFVWVPEDQEARWAALDQAFESLAGSSIQEVIASSDYHTLKARESRKVTTIADLVENLIRPHAADFGNLGIQLRSTAEMGAALRLLQADTPINYLLMDGTLSLPLVGTRDVSLFYEHLKRLCCVKAHLRGIGLFALSKSHGLPATELLEALARQKASSTENQAAEHWYLRLPVPGVDPWEFPLAEGRRLPPAGAVSYLVRFHRNTPLMRLDIDREFWLTFVHGMTHEETRANEHRIFEDLDYAGHDQRAYGYPYPLKAGHDRSSLTQAERISLRKQIIDAAVQAGMKRSLFRDASVATGHR